MDLLPEKRVFVDSTTIHGIESLFRQGEHDPWAKKLAGEFADLFVYADVIHYPIPVRESLSGYDLAQNDTLLRDLARRDSQLFRGESYSTAEPRLLTKEYLYICFNNFVTWVTPNQTTLRRWLKLHHQPWIKERRLATTGHGYTFSLNDLRENPDLEALSKKTSIPQQDIYYAFDSVLKFPFFGEIAFNRGSRYYNHPIRNVFDLPTMRHEKGNLPLIPLTFKDTIAKLVPRLSKDQYTSLLHELKAVVRESDLHKLTPGNFDKSVIRDIAAHVTLPPRLKESAKVIGVGGGIIGGLGAFPTLGFDAAIVGAIISVSTALWTGELPRKVARIKWLRWALKWDVEEQAEKRE